MILCARCRRAFQLGDVTFANDPDSGVRVHYPSCPPTHPAPWSFDLNAYGPSGQHIVVLSDSNKTAIAAALDTPRNGVTQTNDKSVVRLV